MRQRAAMDRDHKLGVRSSPASPPSGAPRGRFEVQGHGIELVEEPELLGAAAFAQEDASIMIHPEAAGRRAWDAFVTVLVLYSALTVPFHLAFDVFPSEELHVLYRLVDIAFLFDVGLNFFTGYFDTGGVLVMDQGMVAKRYYAGWFWVDLAASVPMDLLVPFGPSEVVLRSNTLLRVLKLTKLLSSFRISKLHSSLNRWGQLPPLRFAVLECVQFAIYVFLFAHWFACAFFFVARIDGLQEHYWFNEGKVQNLWEGKLVGNPWKEYVLSLYQALMIMLTIDMNFRPENNRERVMTLCFAAIGAALFLYSMNRIYYAVDTMVKDEREFRDEMDQTSALTRRVGLDAETANKIVAYVEHKHRVRRADPRDTHRMIRGIPSSLQGQLLLQMYRPVTDSALFAECPRNITAAAVKTMRLTPFAPGDALLTAHEPARTAYFILDGHVRRHPSQEQLADRTEPTLLSKGDIVGLEALVRLGGGGNFGVVARSTAFALSFVDTMAFARGDALALLDDVSPETRRKWLGVVDRATTGVATVGGEESKAGQPTAAGRSRANGLLLERLDQEVERREAAEEALAKARSEVAALREQLDAAAAELATERELRQKLAAALQN